MDTIPGSDTLGYGFDITKRYHESSTTEQIFRDGDADARTMTIGTTQYGVPGNIAAESIKKTDGTSQVFSTRQQVQDHFSVKAGISGSGFGFKGQFEASYSHVANSDKSYYYALVEATNHAYNLKLKEQTESWLTPSFAADVNSLPATFSPQTEEQFYAFFGKYGTHYVHQVQLGGSLYYYVAIEKSFESDETKIKAHMDLEYKGVFAKTKATADSSWSQLGKNWASSRSVRLTTQGGDNDLDGLAPGMGDWKGDSFTKWSDSLHNKPGLTGFNLRPISAIVPLAKSAAAKKALVEYLKGGLIVRADREFNPQVTMALPYVAYPTIDGPEGSIRPPQPAPPPTTQEICGVQIVLLDPDTLKQTYNKVWYATVGTAHKMYQDVIADLKKITLADYYCAVSIFGLGPVQYPPPELGAWLNQCGASLTAWHKYIGATTIGGGAILYTFAGRKGSRFGQEAFTIDPSRSIKKMNSTSLYFLRGEGLLRSAQPPAES